MSELKFVELQKEMLTHFEKGNFDSALSIINRVQIDYPEKLYKTSFYKACIYTVLGEHNRAIAALNEGLKCGVWWNPLTLMGNHELQSLQNLEEFKLIVKNCRELYEKEKQRAQSQLFTYGNQNSDVGVFSLHWKAANVKDFSQYWLDEKTVNNYLFGFLQSSQIYGYDSFCWDDQDIANNEIIKTFNHFKNLYHTKQTILTGASQGARLALELSLNNNLLDSSGFIAVIPAITDVQSVEKLLKENKFNGKGCIITGDKDMFYQQTLELKPLFEAYNFPCKWIIIEGLGHYFPDCFTELLTEAVDYILE